MGADKTEDLPWKVSLCVGVDEGCVRDDIGGHGCGHHIPEDLRGAEGGGGWSGCGSAPPPPPRTRGAPIPQESVGLAGECGAGVVCERFDDRGGITHPDPPWRGRWFFLGRGDVQTRPSL